MGWTFQARERGTTDRDFFTQEFSGGGGKVLDVASTLNTAYIAYQTKVGPVYGLVCLKKWDRNSDFNFGWKDMGEEEGPNESEAPARILDLLTDPAPNQYAADWRARCRARLALKAEKHRDDLNSILKILANDVQVQS